MNFHRSRRIGFPKYASDLPQLMLVILNYFNQQVDIYHYSNEGEICLYDFVIAIKDLGRYKCKLNGISSSDYLIPAKKSSFSFLDKSKTIAT